MTPRTVVVAHGRAMVAEGIAAALARFPQIAPVAVATSAADAERHAERADAVAIDADLPGATMVAHRLQRQGVRVVLLGEGAIHDDAVRVSLSASAERLASALVPGAGRISEDSSLTPREREVLALITKGLAGKQVARSLGISPKTVEQHKTRIYSKLKVPNQTAAVSQVLAGAVQGGDVWIRSSI